jgi:Glycosyltransferase like family
MISFIVPVNDESELNANLLASPGICFHEVVQIKEATSAADAFYKGLERATASWIVYVHQDVLMPFGTAAALNVLTRTIDSDDEAHTIIGFVGLGKMPDGTVQPAGTIYDRGHLLDWARSDNAVSLDECCILLHRKCKYKLDPNLGWHLWATDLCLQAQADGHPPRIERHIMYHNSTLIQLPASFSVSAGVLKAKYPGKQIQSLNAI